MINIMMVDDHAIVREGYRALLNTYPDINICVEASSGEAAYHHYKTIQPDVVVLDLNLPEMSGIETLHRIKKYDAKAKILIFSMHSSAIIAIQAMQAGAQGYISKNTPPETLIEAIRLVFQGQIILSPDIEKAIATERVSGPSQAIKSLSPREFEIFQLLVSAKSTQEIADILNISPKTAANCHYQIKSKLGVANDIELIHLAIKLKIISPDDTIS